MNQREELANEIDSCFVNVELADNTDEKEYWKSIGEITDYFISQIKQAEKRARVAILEDLWDVACESGTNKEDLKCMIAEGLEERTPQESGGK